MNWFFFALFSHHGFEPETLCLRKIIAGFANVIEVHAKFFSIWQPQRVLFLLFATNVIQCCRWLLNLLLFPLWKSNEREQPKQRQKHRQRMRTAEQIDAKWNYTQKVKWTHIKERERDAVGQILVENTVRLREIPENQERQLKRGQQINEWNII